MSNFYRKMCSAGLLRFFTLDENVTRSAAFNSIMSLISFDNSVLFFFKGLPENRTFSFDRIEVKMLLA